MVRAVQELLATMLTEHKTWQLYLVQEWKAIVGDVHQHMCLEKIVEDTLWISVFHPHWMQELHLLSGTIMRTINRALQKEYATSDAYVKKLRFRYKDKKKRDEKEESITPEVRSRKHRMLTHAEKKALEKIVDSELHAIMYNLLSLSELK